MHHLRPYPYPPLRPYYPQPFTQQAIPVLRPSSNAAPALFVVGSFLLMMILAGVLSVFGSVAAQALLDDEESDPPAAQTQTVAPSAALTR